ncbi:MAG: spore germination protein [Negativicutes bacterium]|nr:spore germination protein [Negativicutes bacterium]
MNVFVKNWQALKKILVYKPPQSPPPFVLGESENQEEAVKDQLTIAAEEHEALLRYAHRLASTLAKTKECLSDPQLRDKLAELKLEVKALEEQKSQLSPVIQTYSLEEDPLDQHVSTSLEENKLMLERLYNMPVNKDLVLRKIVIPASPPVSALLAFVEGLIDKKVINLSVLQPLMLMGGDGRRLYDGDLVTRLVTEYLPSNQVRMAPTFRDITDSLNLGDTAIFFDGINEAALVETKGQEHRSIDRPTMEQSVRGSQSGFTETLRVNTGMLRALIRSSDLTTEIFTVGRRSNTLCALMYLQSVANPTLVKEAKRRLTSLKVDSLIEAGMLEHLIEETPTIPYPQMLSTERPDRVAAALSEGRLAIFLDGSSFVLVAPVSFVTLFHTGEDFSFSWLVATSGRIIRLLGFILTIMLPSMYIAISYFHTEALPTDLLLAIASAREKVPFPALAEILLMEFSFELLREAGVRIPGMLGSTIGIVGAIILGQAAVSAALVSPITVVVVAVTGLASYTIPDYSLAAAVRLNRFMFEMLAATLGLVGVGSGILATIVILCSMKSLGVPYLAPLAPKAKFGYDFVVRGPAYSQELRPDEISPQDRRRQAKISRQWRKRKPAGEEEEK